jgi:diguanylate cyclase (GGDEF)-like protein/PAS domain S-box-containing protein
MDTRVEPDLPIAADALTAQLQTALTGMAHGLVMFDSAERVVLYNQRFAELSGLPEDFVRPGRTLRELLVARRACGRFVQDIEEYRRELLDDIRNGRSKTIIIDTQDGHRYRVTSVPTGGGGWVATHEDITEQTRAERLIARKDNQFATAIASMSQGLCMYDADKRLVACNRQYAELYKIPDELSLPGTPLRAILEHRVRIGTAAAGVNDYVNVRIEQISKSKYYQNTNKLVDGRYISIVHSPLADGGWISTHEDVTDAMRREESFRLLFENNPVPMWVSHRESLRFLAVNNAAVAHYGYSREQFLAMTVPDLVPGERRESFAGFLRSLGESQFRQNIGQHRRSDGSIIDVATSSQALIYAGQRARLAAVHDITHLKQVENELRQTQKFLDTVIDQVPLPVVVKEVAGAGDGQQGNRFALFNRAYEALTGDSRAWMIGKTPHEIYPKERADLIVESDEEALRSDQSVPVREHPIATADKGVRLVTGRKVAVRDEDGNPRHLLMVLEDVTERRQAERHIWHLAHNDSLTGLPNRATFIETFNAAIEKAKANGEQFTVLCLDLDRFKAANDAYGHLIGDGLLREAARRLKAAAGGTFLARVGGDEFTLIVPGSPEAAEALSEKMLAAFKPDFEVEGHRLQLGLSIGGAVYPADGTDVRTLIVNADAALYQAKAEMRGSARFFEAKLGERLRERRDMQSDLQAAIGRGELSLHYQPQQAIASGDTVGFEALVRWQCPKRGMVPAGAFIPIAEESTLILHLGDWILHEACREAASWGNPFKVAVNISPMQFRQGDLPRVVHAALLDSGLAPHRLELEITEGVMIDDFSRAVSVLRKIKALGVQIALDDFGTGYSSLSYLHAFPFDRIKIDRTFINDLETNHHSRAIVRAVLGLGRSLNVPILAEGVETQEQLAFLANESCNEVQGYLTGRPCPIADYAELVGGKAAEIAGAPGAARARRRKAS